MDAFSIPFDQFISTVGFPIAACVVMWWQNGKLQKTLADISIVMQKMADEMDDIEQRLERIEHHDE